MPKNPSLIVLFINMHICIQNNRMDLFLRINDYFDISKLTHSRLSRQLELIFRDLIIEIVKFNKETTNDIMKNWLSAIRLDHYVIYDQNTIICILIECIKHNNLMVEESIIKLRPNIYDTFLLGYLITDDIKDKLPPIELFSRAITKIYGSGSQNNKNDDDEDKEDEEEEDEEDEDEEDEDEEDEEELNNEDNTLLNCLFYPLQTIKPYIDILLKYQAKIRIEAYNNDEEDNVETIEHDTLSQINEETYAYIIIHSKSSEIFSYVFSPNSLIYMIQHEVDESRFKNVNLKPIKAIDYLTEYRKRKHDSQVELYNHIHVKDVVDFIAEFY
jgi:hypothetical protein